ncbi:MAG: hypothetical protein A2075_22010 [Geobacteraceae bacterium GWC2_58_44]|nr:MAG: hypothetical protein A2075_22010 [Geobacteraceae bacterium GWC2_58_44]
MQTLKDIIAKRSAPGVLILDLEGRLLYSNQEALELLAVLRENDGEQALPREVYDLCGELRGRSDDSGTVFGVIGHRGGGGETEALCSIRAFLLGDHREAGDPSHVMVLMEKIIRNRQVDIAKAREKYQLSKRETEVLGLICQGLSNKEISSAIFISEFTVKDHIKRIMKKMGTGSRNEIIAALL